MEFEELFNLEEISKVMEDKNRDTERKELGDRVQIIDFSSCTHIDGRPLDYDLEDDEMVFNFHTELIVIATREQAVYDAYYVQYEQDLVVINTLTNRRFRIGSGHVTLR